MKNMRNRARYNLISLPKSVIVLFFGLLTLLVIMSANPRPAQALTETPGKDVIENSSQPEIILSLRLAGVASYEIAEIFNDIVVHSPGVIEARRCYLNLDPRQPRAALVEWQITFRGDSVFNLESSIYSRLKEILSNKPVIYPVNGSDLTLTDFEIGALASIKPASAGSRNLNFVATTVFAGNQPWRHQVRHRVGYRPAWSSQGFE